MFGESERTRKAREKIGMPSKDSHEWGMKISPAKLKRYIFFALAAYPVGCLMLLFAAEGLNALALGGLALIVLAAFATFPVFSSRLYKIVGDGTLKLDEFETQLRLKSISTAYHILMAIVLIAIIYLAIAADKETLWLPTTYDHYNAIFWGATLYAMLIPAAVLTWRLGDAPMGEED